MNDNAIHSAATRGTFWTLAAFYFLIAFEFFYMATPFAVYFYSAYGPGLSFINSSPALAWLSSVFLPHYIETSSAILNLHNAAGAVLFVAGLLGFSIGAAQVYYYKIRRKGPVTGGIYQFIRHPQYAHLMLSSFGLLLLWPRYIVLLSFIIMLFAYYALARIEERECLRKFGADYRTYLNQTHRFLPFRLILVDRLFTLPPHGLRRVFALMALFVLCVMTGIGIADGLRLWTLHRIVGHYSGNAAYLSVVNMNQATLDHLVAIVEADSAVQHRGCIDGKTLNYVLPAEWLVPEIPMNPPNGRLDHHAPASYRRDLYKVIYMRSQLRGRFGPEGREILTNTVQRIPLAEVWVDLSANRVIEIKPPPVHAMYQSIPVPLF